MTTRDYSKDFDRYARELERNIATTIAETRLAQVGIVPTQQESNSLLQVGLGIVGFVAAVAVAMWLPDHDNAND